jgi:hypothetical protein
MRTLIYKRTHSGDPDRENGMFGTRDCMGTVRGRQFDAVIGVGGIGLEPTRHGIAGKLTWVGTGPYKIYDPNHPRSPRVLFDHFLYLGECGPLLEVEYPALASRMYEKPARAIMHLPSSRALFFEHSPGVFDLDRDVEKILGLAKNEPASGFLFKRKLRHARGRCRSPQISPCYYRKSNAC